MPFQGNQGEVDSLVGHGIRGADDGTQVVQLTQIQIAQIVSNAVSQALTHQMQQIAQIVSNAVSQALTHQAQQFRHPSSSMYQHSRVIVQQAG